MTKPREGKLYENINQDVNELFMQQKLFNSRHRTLFENGSLFILIIYLLELEDVGKRQLIFSIIESLVIILITLWQVIYIKKLMGFDRIL